jgi:uncharacterized protein (TIGR02246 family)
MKGLITVLAVLVVIGVGFLLYSSPSAPPEMTEAERAQAEAGVREEIANRFDSYRDALLTGDEGAFMSMYTSDARVFWPGMNLDKNELQAAMAEMFQGMTWTAYDVDLQDLFVAGDAAYAIYQLSETFQAEGQEPGSENWNCFTRWEKEEGVWKVDRDVCGLRDAPPEG